MVSSVPLNGPALLDFTVNGRGSQRGRAFRRATARTGRARRWSTTTAGRRWRRTTPIAPHPGGYNDWCVIVCHSDEEWQRLVAGDGLAGVGAASDSSRRSPAASSTRRRSTRTSRPGRTTLGKYELTRALPGGGRARAARAERRGPGGARPAACATAACIRRWSIRRSARRKVQNAPFKLSRDAGLQSRAEPADRRAHARDRRGAARLSAARSCAQASPTARSGRPSGPRFAYHGGDAAMSGRTVTAGPLAGLRVLELADEKGQFCGKLLGDLGADVVKIEPPGGEAARRVGPFLDDIPHPERSLSFWYYNTSKRGITPRSGDGGWPRAVPAPGGDGRRHSRNIPARAIWRRSASATTRFGQRQPGADHVLADALRPDRALARLRLSSDLLHMAAGGEMASCGYDEADVADAPPIAPGGGNAWHMGGHFAYMAIMAALVYRTVSGAGPVHRRLDPRGLRADDRGGDRQLRLPRRGAATPDGAPSRAGADAAHPVPRQGRQLCHARWSPAGSPRNTSRSLPTCSTPTAWPAISRIPNTRTRRSSRRTPSHIIDDLVADFIASLPAEEVYHAAQERGFTWGAVRAPEALLDDAHLSDRGFWKTVEHPGARPQLRLSGRGRDLQRLALARFRGARRSSASTTPRSSAANSASREPLSRCSRKPV